MGNKRRLITLGDLGPIITGKTPPTKVPGHFGGTTPFVTPRDMDGRKTIDSTERYLTEKGVKALGKAVIPSGSIMVSCIGSDMGKVAIAGRQCVTNQQINSIIVSEENIAAYVYYDLSQRKNELRLMASGSAQPILNKGHFSQLKIEIPAQDEQRAIACILGTLDDKIELNRRMNETLEAMARAIFKSWFVDFDPVRAKAEGRQPPGLAPHIADLFPDSFEDSELGEIPEGWRVGTLGGVSEKAQYGYTATATDESIGPRFLRIKDINKQDWIEWQNVPYCEIEKHKIDKYRLAKGDVVIARMADPGHGALIEEDIDAVFASYLIRFRPIRPELGRFLQYWLRSETYWNLVISRQSGTTRANLNAQVLSSFPLVVPDDNVLKAFSNQVDALRSKLVANVNESRILATLRDTLLPKLISGELRLPDADRIVGRCV